MGAFSIKDIEQISGIKAHTIRIWEKRYGILAPCRSETNIRQYTDNDLRKILNIATLNKNGRKISRLAKLSDDELYAETYEFLANQSDFSNIIDSLILYMLDYDEARYRQSLDKHIANYGFELTLKDIIFPFLMRVGLRWQTGILDPSHEHFATSIIREYIFSEIKALPVPSSNANPVVFFLPENEYHDITLLSYLYVTKKSGIATLNLGQSIPLEYLVGTVKSINAKALFTSITTTSMSESVEHFVEELATLFPDRIIFISCRHITSSALAMYPNMHLITSYHDYLHKIESC